MRDALGPCAAALCWLASAVTLAQEPPADAVPPPPPSGAEAPPAPPEPAPPPVAPLDAACTPACREGFMCHEGTCISACNPPCAAGEQCTSSGACVLTEPSFGAPAGLPASDEPWVSQDRTVEAHDGFMLRLALGFGGGTMTAQASGFEDEEYSGPGGTFSIDLGGAPSENLIIHARLVDFLIFDPTLSVGGMEVADTTDVTLGGVLVGVGLTYYFMPINLYVTGAIGPSRISLQVRGDERGQSDWGFGLNFDLGKEWWVGDQWGIGVALRIWYNTVSETDGGVDGTLDFTAAALMFSATYQ